MPIIKSAKKRVKVAKKASVRNAKTRRTLREAIKAFNVALAGEKTDKVAEAHKAATSAIDTAAKKNVIHKNKAARKKHQLTGEKTDKVAEAHKAATSAIDTAAKKNVIHKNKAARKKHQLTVALKKSGLKTTGSAKKSATKAATKPAAKKTIAKKPAAKATAPKKPTAEKSATKSKAK